MKNLAQKGLYRTSYNTHTLEMADGKFNFIIFSEINFHRISRIYIEYHSMGSNTILWGFVDDKPALTWRRLDDNIYLYLWWPSSSTRQWCDVMWCDWCDVIDVMWCGVVWCDVMWCDVMWYDMIYDMWCDVMWWDGMWWDGMWWDVMGWYMIVYVVYDRIDR